MQQTPAAAKTGTKAVLSGFRFRKIPCRRRKRLRTCARASQLQTRFENVAGEWSRRKRAPAWRAVEWHFLRHPRGQAQ
eukprot:2234224-Rhodomonas_salina.1